MAIGEIFSGQPKTLTYDTGGTLVTITDVQGVDIDESGSNFAHYGDDKSIPQDGGANTDVAISGSLRTRNVNDAFQAALKIGALITTPLIAVLAKKGTAGTDMTITAAIARVTSRAMSGDDRKEVTIGFDAFSDDGAAWPITYSVA